MLPNALEREQRLTLFDFELVRLARPDSAHAAWTWRMSASAYENLRARILDTVRRGDTRTVRQLIISLYRSPGFRGVRSQIGHAVALLRAEWRRRRGGQLLPPLPKLLPYVRRLPNETVPLSMWLSAQVARPVKSQA